MASPLNEVCVLRAALAGVAGYGLGLAIGAFMNAMEFRQIEFGRGLRATTRDALRVDLQRIRGTARGFARFGAAFVFFECLLEKFRRRNDKVNSFFAGGASTVFLALDSGMRWRGLATTAVTGGLFAVLMEKLMGFQH